MKTDLRIGNHLLRGDQLVTVEELRYNAARCRYTLDGEERVSLIRYEDLRGIDITEEWLKRIGFVTDTIFRRGFAVSVDDGFILFYNNHPERYHDHITTLIPYVHQLQNLYYASTGNELTIKEELP